MCDPEKVAEASNMIVNGYAFTLAGPNRVRILNLNAPAAAAVLSASGELLETNMDDIEVEIVREYYLNNKEFMGERHA